MRSNLRVLGVFLLVSAAQAGSYTVQKNDTLYSLAKRFDITIEELLKLNGMTEPKLTLGQTLKVPDAKPVAKPAVKPAPALPREHVVGQKETLFGIAKKYGLKTEDLKKFNDLTSNDLAVGQVLKLHPETTASKPVAKETASAKTPAPKAEAKPAPAATSTKTESSKATPPVKPESKPAEAKTVTVTPLPAKPTTSTTTAKTDTKTASGTANKTDTTKAPEAKTTLAKTPEVAKPAATQKEPAQTATVKTEPAPANSATSSKDSNKDSKEAPKAAKVKPVLTGATTYVVQKGDNLYNLARKFGVTVDELMDWNALDTHSLDVGQNLQLIARVQPAPEVKPEVKEELKASLKEPVQEPVRVTSTVKPSAEQEKVTIQPVQVVDNAVTLTPSSVPERHVVQKGDTLSVLARKYSTTVGAIQEANNLLDTRLQVGQVLILPNSLKNIPEPSNLINIVSTTPNPWRDYAMSLMNIPYVYGGTNPEKGLDCSGFTLLVMQQAGIKLPRTSLEQSRVGEDVDLQELQEGDLIFFDTLGHGVSHVGIYLGDNQFIHANSYLERVSIDDITNNYYAKRVVGVKRVLAPLTTAQR